MQLKKLASVSSKLRLPIVLLAAIAIILGVAALKAIRPVAMPLAFAVLIAILVNPLRSWLNRKLPQWLSLIIVLIVIMAVLGVLGGTLWVSIEQLEPELPSYVDRLSQLWQSMSAQLNSWGISLNGGTVSGTLQNGSWQNILERAIGSGRAILGSLSLFALIISLLALLLLEVDEYHDRTQAAFSGGTSHRLIDAFSNMSKKLRRYFAVMTFTSVLTGGLTLLWCWILGVNLALVWASLAFVLNFIPTIGSIIAAIIPALVALLLQGPAIGLATLVGLAIIQIILGNFVDPRLQGKYLQLSPFVALLSVVFWGWIWGIPGAFLGVPMTTAIILLSGEFRQTKAIAIMLGNLKQ